MADINVTPLVDVMLVLLIVFMITMPVLTHSIPLELPTTSQKADQQPKQDIKPTAIIVDETGAYAIGADSTQHLNLNELKQQLIQLHTKDPDTIIAITADKKVPYDHVAQLLDTAREVGFSKVGFITKVGTEQ